MYKIEVVIIYVQRDIYGNPNERSDRQVYLVCWLPGGRYGQNGHQKHKP